MKAYEGFKSEPRQEKYPLLPPRPYVAGIKNVKIDGTEPDQQLVLRMDIIEGEYAGYYSKHYQHESQNAGFHQQFQAKYKGDLRIQIPNSANGKRQHPEWDVKTFNNAIYAIEQSNPGYHWDWNEASLIGKVVGLNVQEGTYNGNPFTVPARLEVADDVRNGAVKPMKPRKPTGDAAATAQPDSNGFTPVEVDGLPF